MHFIHVISAFRVYKPLVYHVLSAFRVQSLEVGRSSIVWSNSNLILNRDT